VIEDRFHAAFRLNRFGLKTRIHIAATRECRNSDTLIRPQVNPNQNDGNKTTTDQVSKEQKKEEPKFLFFYRLSAGFH
jgi:hypothetical protein